MVIRCGELDCKENAIYQDECGCVFCNKHKWHKHSKLTKVFDPFPKGKFVNARSNDYLEGNAEGKSVRAKEELEKILKELDFIHDCGEMHCEGEIFKSKLTEFIEKRLKSLEEKGV